MRHFCLVALLSGALWAQGWVEVDQMHLQLGLREGTALYDMTANVHIPGREPVKQRGVLRMTVDAPAQDGSAWVRYAYDGFSVDGKASTAEELASMNAVLGRIRLKMSPTWRVLEVEGELIAGLKDARASYHEALDRYQGGDRRALGDVVRRGLRLSALLLAERLAGLLTQPQFSAPGASDVMESLRSDPEVQIQSDFTLPVGPAEITLRNALVGRYLFGIERIFRVESGFKVEVYGNFGIEAESQGNYNQWGLPKNLDSRFEVYAGPFGGSVNQSMSLISFTKPKADVALYCSVCGEVVGDTARVIHDAYGTPHRLCGGLCEMSFLFGADLSGPVKACAHCGVKGKATRVLTAADGRVLFFCDARCEMGHLFKKP